MGGGERTLLDYEKNYLVEKRVACDPSYLLDTIDLQLHATTVTSNPYTTTATKNTTITASLKNSIPETNTYLYDKQANYDIYETITITIPTGVNVVYVVADTEGMRSGDICYSRVYSKSSDTVWGLKNQDHYARFTSYVGVTPGKTYTLVIDCSSAEGASDASCFIAYSQSINNEAPTVTDY